MNSTLFCKCFVWLYLTGVALAQNSSVPCSTPEYRQFDFWVGDWDVFETDTNEKSAYARVERILGGCAIREQYQALDGSAGQSFSSFEPESRRWQQTWVDNRGRLLVIRGSYGDQQMTFAGEFAGSRQRVRAAWVPRSGKVRETASRSDDGGKTWRPWFDLTFSRRDTMSSAEEDKHAVETLDTKYQDAVKRNDAAAMDSILADDFVLVTGTGKTYTKADLLAEARRGNVRYEHQEDTDRTVRVWGDAAVVTAKLWEKGTEDAKAFDHTGWFSDTYVRTALGWKYVFGQSARPLSAP